MAVPISSTQPSSSAPLGPLVGLWLSKIRMAEEYKEQVYGATARECRLFFDGPHDFMYSGNYARNGTGMYLAGEKKIKSTFRVTTNKVAELVQRFGPSLYFNNPSRKVESRSPDIDLNLLTMMGTNPMMVQMMQQGAAMRKMATQAKSTLMSWYLNFTPNELNLRKHSRLGITEGLIAGMGVSWTEIYQPRGSQRKLIGSFNDVATDTLVFDPDVDMVEHGTFAARRCTHPVWQVEDEYGWPRGSLKGNMESSDAQSRVDSDPDKNSDRVRGKTNDLLVYYKIYSRMGIGARLSGADQSLAETIDQFGDNVFLVVAKGVDSPLNLPPDLLNANTEEPGVVDALKQALSWPIPFWADNAWPFSELGFHEVPGCPYPMSHMKPGLGELRFINWALSFLANKMYFTSRDFIAIAEHAEQDLETQIKEGEDLCVIKLKQSLGKKIGDMVQFIQHPGMNRDILDIVNLAMQMFDKRVALTELMYGISPTQMRSAAEAEGKMQMTTVVVDDMRECVEDWQSAIARKEAIAMRLFAGPYDVAPMFGEQFDPAGLNVGPLTQLWSALVYNPNPTPDQLEQMVREFDYRIEAESLRKPNTQRDVANVDQAIQIMGPGAQNFYGATGDPTQLNALYRMWGKSRQFEDIDQLMYPPMMPPAPPQSGEGGGENGNMPPGGK